MGQTITETARYLEQGQAAPYNGYILTEDTTQKVQKDLVKKDFLEKQTESLSLEIKFKDLEIEGLERRNDIYVEENNKLRRGKEMNKWIYLGLGVLGTSLAVYGAGQLK